MTAQTTPGKAPGLPQAARSPARPARRPISTLLELLVALWGRPERGPAEFAWAADRAARHAVSVNWSPVVGVWRCLYAGDVVTVDGVSVVVG